MNCRIELSGGELHRFAPNLDYLTTLLNALGPPDVCGTIAVRAGVDGVRLEFRGTGDWVACENSVALIPRWMFCEIAFRELVAARAGEFIESVEALEPAERPGGAKINEMDWQPGWIQ